MQVIAGLFELVLEKKTFSNTYDFCKTNKSDSHKSTQMAKTKQENIQQRGVSAQYGSFSFQVKSKAFANADWQTVPGLVAFQV